MYNSLLDCFPNFKNISSNVGQHHSCVKVKEKENKADVSAQEDRTASTLLFWVNQMQRTTFECNCSKRAAYILQGRLLKKKKSKWVKKRVDLSVN